MSRDGDDKHTDPRHEALGRTARERFEQVEPEVAHRLAQMRRAAVAELDRREARIGARRLPGWWIGGAAAAAVALTVALLLLRGGDPEPDPDLLADAEAIEAIADLDVLEELEFLAWLEEEQLDAGQG